jgi:hypothetical protein
MKKVKINTYKMGETIINTPSTLPFEKIGEKIRLIAGSMKILTNGSVRKKIVEINIEDENLWQEVDYIEEDIPEKPIVTDTTNYKELLDIITGADTE